MKFPKHLQPQRLILVALISMQVGFSINATSQANIPPYSTSFETNADTIGWTHYADMGTDDWEWGAPDGNVIYDAPTGVNAWKTNLDGDYAQVSQRNLVSPYFDLSNTAVDYVLSFRQERHSSGPQNYWVEYNLNGSSTWQILFNAGVDKQNWQTGSGFTMNQTSPILSKTNISWIQGNDSVRFRFHIYNNLYTGDGWMIDDFTIEEEEYDITAQYGDTLSHITKYYTEIEVSTPYSFINEYNIAKLVTNEFYLSTNPILDIGDILLGAYTINMTGGGFGSTHIFPLPPNLNAGPYYVISSYDVTNNLAESDETDNENLTVIILDSVYTNNYFSYFDSAESEWTASPAAPGYEWSRGSPDFWHVNAARSQPNVWHVADESLGFTEYIESPYFDLTTGVNTTLCFWFKAQYSSGIYTNGLQLHLPSYDEPIIEEPYFPNLALYKKLVYKARLYDWDCACFDLSLYDGEPSTKFRIYGGGSSQISIDDFYLGAPKPDAAIQGFEGDRFTSTTIPNDTLRYYFFNGGLTSMISSTTEFYWSADSLFDLSDVFLGSKTESAMTDTSLMITAFPYTKPTAAPGIFFIIAKIDANNEIDEMHEYDNLKVFQIHQQSPMPLPYFNDFESQITDWRHDASRNSDDWHWGDPEGSEIDTAFSGSKAFFTGTNGVAVELSRMHLFTPIFNLSQLNDPVLEFDVFNDFFYGGGGLMSSNGGNIMYSVDGGFSWIDLDTCNASFKHLYYLQLYHTETGDEDIVFNYSSLYLYGHNKFVFQDEANFQGRDYDEDYHYVVSLECLEMYEQIQFMFVYFVDSTITNGMMVDNFQISEKETDLLVPTDKTLLASSEDTKINFYFNVKNDANYISQPSMLNLYCSSDTLIDVSDTLFYSTELEAIMPYKNRQVLLNYDTPVNFGSYNYLLYELDAGNTNSETNETNNIGHFYLAMDSCENFNYPLLFDFEDEYIDGWSWYHDSSEYFMGHRFRHIALNNDPADGVSSGQWFLDNNYYGFGSYGLSAIPIHFLEGPAFDFSDHTDIHLTFDFMCLGGPSGDSQGGNMEYSIDGGQTWILLTETLDPFAVNWYNLSVVEMLNDEEGWGFGSVWKTAEFDLTFLTGEDNVRFRFKYRANWASSVNQPRGFRLDNFAISAEDYTAFPPITICEGQSATIFGNIETISGIYTQVLTDMSGMDSTLAQELIVYPALQQTEFVSLCAHENYVFPDGDIVTDIIAGFTHTSTFSAVNGCDSLIQTTLSVTLIDTTITEIGLQLVSNNLGGSYQWLDCNNGYAEIPGAISTTFTPASMGYYAVEITENGCIDTSSCLLLTDLGNDEYDFSDVSIHPNPTTRSVFVDLGPTFGEVDITVFNLLGEKIFSQKFQSNEIVNFEIVGARGFYLIEVTSAENKSKTFKILKE